jgi:hypothetical protein
LTGKHEFDEVIQEASVLKASRRQASRFADHGGFIDDEQGVGSSIGGEAKSRSTIGGSFGSIDVAVNR